MGGGGIAVSDIADAVLKHEAFYQYANYLIAHPYVESIMILPMNHALPIYGGKLSLIWLFGLTCS